MDLKRSMIWMAMIAILLASPAMAIDWQKVKCCDATKCGEDVGCCDAQEYCCQKTVGIEVGGWMSSGIYSNQYGAKSNGPLYMRDYGDGYTVDQMWIHAEKKADNGGSGLAFGGRVDFMWGADGPDTQCFGDGGWDGAWMTSKDDNYGSALPQLYAEMAYNDLNVKVGHFYTIIGYEVVPAPENFFYSHSYAMAFEPLTHMGVLADYKMTDRLSVQSGWVNGWDNGWVNPSGASTFLGGVKYKLGNRASLAYATSFGDLQDRTVTAGQPNFKSTGYIHSLVFQWQMNCRMKYVMQSNFLTTADEGTGALLRSRKGYGIDQYLFYTINNRWSAGTRVEWFRGEIGALAGPVETGNAVAVTLGLHYKPTDRITFRPEIRWDCTSGDPIRQALVFDNNTRSSQFSGGFDFIYSF